MNDLSITTQYLLAHIIVNLKPRAEQYHSETRFMYISTCNTYTYSFSYTYYLLTQLAYITIRRERGTKNHKYTRASHLANFSVSTNVKYSLPRFPSLLVQGP